MFSKKRYHKQLKNNKPQKENKKESSNYQVATIMKIMNLNKQEQYKWNKN